MQFHVATPTNVSSLFSIEFNQSVIQSEEWSGGFQWGTEISSLLPHIGPQTGTSSLAYCQCPCYGLTWLS